MVAIYNQPHVPTLDKALSFLVVDDFETMRRVNVNQLRQLGTEKIFTAKGGKEALRVLKAQPIDVVLSDWNMPLMSGLELLRAIREDAKLFTLPFIMITAEAERPRVEEAIASGVTSMLLKPFSPGQLMIRLEKALTWKPSRVPIAVSTTTSESTPIIFVTAKTSAEAHMKGLDLEAVDFVTKPIDPQALKHRVRNFMRYVQMRKNLQADYDGMVEVAQLPEHVEHVARHDIKGPRAGCWVCCMD